MEDNKKTLKYNKWSLSHSIEKYYCLISDSFLRKKLCKKKFKHFLKGFLGKSNVKRLLDKMPELVKLYEKDVEALYASDPSAGSRKEIILAYPGLFAVTVYRLAHELYLMKIPYLPRLFSEYAHSKTGIDIHPGAEIGDAFCIDHGTGIVIGETTVIKNNVRLYHGVTLGAISLVKGNRLKGVKRHPTIMDNVIIYSGAGIFGGETVIGKNSVIGANVIVSKSVADDTVVLKERGV